jgi:hypothetical protein
MNNIKFVSIVFRSLGGTVAGFLPLRSGFDSEPIHVQFLVHKVAL